MSIDLPLDKMTLADKLEAMEKLWADLSQTPTELPSPSWHADILAERLRQAESGNVKFIDLEDAMAEVRKHVRENPRT